VGAGGGGEGEVYVYLVRARRVATTGGAHARAHVRAPTTISPRSRVEELQQPFEFRRTKNEGESRPPYLNLDTGKIKKG
jgi:hypothetical protein